MNQIKRMNTLCITKRICGMMLPLQVDIYHIQRTQNTLWGKKERSIDFRKRMNVLNNYGEAKFEMIPK